MKIFGNIFSIFRIFAIILLTLMQVGHNDASAVVGNSRSKSNDFYFEDNFTNRQKRDERGAIVKAVTEASVVSSQIALNGSNAVENKSGAETSIYNMLKKVSTELKDETNNFTCTGDILELGNYTLYPKLYACARHIEEIQLAANKNSSSGSSSGTSDGSITTSYAGSSSGTSDDPSSGDDPGSGDEANSGDDANCGDDANGMVISESKGQSVSKCPDFTEKSILDSAKKISKCLKKWDDAQEGASQSSSASPIIKMTFVMALIATTATLILQAI